MKSTQFKNTGGRTNAGNGWVLITWLLAFFLLPGWARSGMAQPADSVFTPVNQPEMAHALSDTLPDTKTTRWLRAAAAPAAAGALAATYFWVDHDMRHDLPEDQSPFKDFVARWAEPVGRSVTITPGFGILLTYGLVAKDKRARKAGIIGLSTYYLNDGITTQLKKTFGRMRPSSGAGYDNWFAGEPHRSFPSSHTSTAFAAATVLASVYHDKKLVAPIAYSVATVVGFSRLYHNQHWASDVVAGALVGYLTAKATLFTYSFIERKWKGRSRLTVLPQLGPQRLAATAVLTF